MILPGMMNWIAGWAQSIRTPKDEPTDGHYSVEYLCAYELGAGDTIHTPHGPSTVLGVNRSLTTVTVSYLCPDGRYMGVRMDNDRVLQVGRYTA